MAAPAYASSVAQPNFRQAPVRSPRRQPAPSGPRTSPRRPPGTRPRDPRVIPPRPAPTKPALPKPSAPPPDYNPRPAAPPKPFEAPRSDPFKPISPRGLPVGVALDLAGKALAAYSFVSIFIDPDQIFYKLGAFGGLVVSFKGNEYTVDKDCGLGPIGTAWGWGGAGGMCGTPLQVPGSEDDYGGTSPADGGVYYVQQELVDGRVRWNPSATYLYRGPFAAGRIRYNINHAWGPFPQFVEGYDVPYPSSTPAPSVRNVQSPGTAMGAEIAPPLAQATKPGEFYSQPSQWWDGAFNPAKGIPASWPWLDPLESSFSSYGPKSQPLPTSSPSLQPYEVPQLGQIEITPHGGVKPAAGGGHQRRPPNSDERERKHRMGNGTLRAVMGILSALTEAGDLIDAIYKSIPAKGTHRRWKGRDGKWREAAITPQDKLAFIAANYDKINLGDALMNIAENELEDRAFGYLGNKLKNTYQGNHDAGYKPNNYRGFQSGPAL